MRLRSKLVTGQLLLASSLWVVARYAEESSRDALEELLVEKTESQASAVLDEVQRALQTQVRSLEAYARNQVVQEALEASNRTFRELPDITGYMDEQDAAWVVGRQGEVTPFMQGLMDNACAQELRAHRIDAEEQYGYPVYGEIFLTNRHGANIAQTGVTTDYRQDDEAWWQRARDRGLHISDPSLDESSGIISVDLCVRLVDTEGTFCGVLKGVLDFQYVTRLLDARANGTGANLTLFGSDGQPIHDTAGRQDGTRWFDQGGLRQSRVEGVGVLQGENRSETPIVVAGAVPVQGSLGYAPDWTLVAEFPMEGVIEPAQSLGHRILLVAFAVTVLSLSFGLLHSFSLSRRIDALRDAMRRIREGDLDHQVEDERSDELGELARSFNEMTSDLQGARRAADAARRAKDSFLANMSHEIRTPMTAVVGSAELLADAHLSEEERVEHIRTVRASAQHLLSLINGILDLSKIESGNLVIERIPCSPVDVAQEVIELMTHQATSKGLTLTLDLATPVPATIETDPTRLRQILVNLVGNSLKFTKTGGVRIVCRYEPDAENGPRLAFSVIDTGIGMTSEQIERVVHPFVQADMSSTRRYGGTGLGLAISKQLAEALGGGLTIGSRPGEGSIFRVTIDVVRGPGDLRMISTADLSSRGVSNYPETQVAPDLTGSRILVVEDVDVNRRLISSMLERAGAEVETASDGRAGLVRARAAWDGGCSFDVILMDLMMPVLDGLGAMLALREKGYTGRIIALTADALKESRDRCLRSGFDGFVNKPVSREELLMTVHHHLRIARSA